MNRLAFIALVTVTLSGSIGTGLSTAVKSGETQDVKSAVASSANAPTRAAEQIGSTNGGQQPTTRA